MPSAAAEWYFIGICQLDSDWPDTANPSRCSALTDECVTVLCGRKRREGEGQRTPLLVGPGAGRRDCMFPLKDGALFPSWPGGPLLVYCSHLRLVWSLPEEYMSSRLSPPQRQSVCHYWNYFLIYWISLVLQAFEGIICLSENKEIIDRFSLQSDSGKLVDSLLWCSSGPLQRSSVHSVCPPAKYLLICTVPTNRNQGATTSHLQRGEWKQLLPAPLGSMLK
ncbi:uncharacterized protein LOC119798948 [Cyprinodon tularosa]|uniref:uncharacterized protein LOC119798948 n=1 Tax=Cyprinodon tularosa TaxID=77115 RepID=UPI0018E23627|nr:uncharacterized protein LOC119798948 [Cyprinodon tularosa]